ncbi:MAG TPA: DUF2723 domain-containing protein [Candidatus Baltobacteraceae bacterium]
MPSLLAIVASFVLPLIVYVRSLDGGIGFWDTGEMQTVPYIAGIGHPTGYPTFIILGWLFSHAIPIGSVAWRMTFMCALCYASSSLALYVFARRERAREIPALLAALCFALAPAVWSHATHTDVFAVTVLASSIVLLLLQRWRSSHTTPVLACAGLVFGVALGNQLSIVWLLPGILLYAFVQRRSLRISALAASVGSAILGAFVYAYLPLRSAANFAARRDPTLALGIPPGRPIWDYAHPAKIQNALWLVSGAQVHAASSLQNLLDFKNLASGLPRVAALFWHGSSPLLALLALVGVAILLARKWRWGIILLAFALAAWPFIVLFPQETEPMRYLLVPIWLAAAFGATALDAAGPYVGGVVGALVLALELIAGRSLFGLPADHLGQTYVATVVAATPPNAIIVAPWVLATPLAYAAYVDHSTGERILDIGFLPDDAKRIPAWVRARPVYVVQYATPSVPGLSFHLIHRLNVDPDLARDAKIWRVSAMRTTAPSSSAARRSPRRGAHPRRMVSPFRRRCVRTHRAAG